MVTSVSVGRIQPPAITTLANTAMSERRRAAREDRVAKSARMKAARVVESGERDGSIRPARPSSA